MAKFTRESLVDDILKDSAAVQVLDSHMPGVTKNPAIKMVRKFTLEKLTRIPQANLSSEALDKLLAEINAKVGE